MGPLRRNGKPRHIGAGTQRRQKREAVDEAKRMVLYKPLLDVPPTPPTRQQLRKQQRTVEKGQQAAAKLELRSILKRRKRALSPREKARWNRVVEKVRNADS